MGLKIHRMLREDEKTPEELEEEARRRKEMSDSILEIIYNKIISGRKGHSKAEILKREDEDDEEGWDD